MFIVVIFQCFLQINWVSCKPEKYFTVMANIPTFLKLQKLDQTFN